MTLELQQDKIDKLEKQLKIQQKINQSLMYQVERSFDSKGDSFSDFQTAIILDDKVKERTKELQDAQKKLKDSNNNLILLNRELQQKQKDANMANKAKSEFLANMSHELRTPLNAILGYSEILEEDFIDNDQQEYIADICKINSAGKHLLNLVNDVLNLSKIEAGKMDIYLEHCNLYDFFEELIGTIQPLIDNNKNRLKTNYKLEFENIQTDITKIRQILFNLLSNATKFTKNGNIDLHIITESKSGQDYLMFKVIDDGLGISLKQQQKLFKAFSQADASTTRKFGGTGLGLVLCKHFTELMGGNISLISEIDQGTAFEVIIPTIKVKR
jgi:signal transduction histidine kinase